jgi:hypothetical protein
MVQVSLNFAPARFAVLGEAVNEAALILFRGIEVGVNKGKAIGVTIGVEKSWVFAAPEFEAALLFIVRGAGLAVFWNEGRFEVIGERDDQMDRAARGTAREALPGIIRKPAESIGDLFSQTDAGADGSPLATWQNSFRFGLINGHSEFCRGCLPQGLKPFSDVDSCCSVEALLHPKTALSTTQLSPQCYRFLLPRTPMEKSETLKDSRPQLSNQRKTSSYVCLD